MSTITVSRPRSITTSILLVAVLGSIANAAVALGAVSVGAPANGMPLQPVAYVTLTVIASVAGAFGWRTIEVRAQRPERVFRWLVPATLLLSLVPDVILGTSGAWEWSVVLAAIAMHVATIAIAVAVYVWQMPVRRDQL
ncbi:DUF6069 family protein [Leifsonia sp. C5G2]|uniref:DUF6069 family protein n=1 Tax=Leifsonia sp. C5G2 TaxID=2735269 RepID=UPI0015847223|nr:DUF6069 family protein [Leifsonia sp. C5G2]NUU06253.1 hypothetical protein [Leifsonia sp. C5G2]